MQNDIWDNRTRRFPTFADPLKFDRQGLINMIAYLKSAEKGFGLSAGSKWYLDLCEAEFAERQAGKPGFVPHAGLRE